MSSFSSAIAEKIGADRALVRALEQLTQGQGLLLVHSQRRWASITFQGTRHSFTWAFDGAAAVAAGEAMIEALPDHEFAIPGQLVAAATVTEVEHRILPEPPLVVDFEILMLEDA